ncbi:MAG: ATP-binding cassette domain-containing protein [Anaerolineales bacterium]|nr:ATP-binding cassette domain-containing protein [Anaerolineales bacterium]
MPILEGEGVSKYFGGLAAVSNVDFSVDRGELVGLIGPNGAGKTTLFNLISGALTPNSGEIKFNTETITGLKPHRICKKGVARTFQSVKVFPEIPVFANVLLGSMFGRSSPPLDSDAEDETAGFCAMVGLIDMLETPAKKLTLANRKRLELARALATKPQLLLLDEMMAGLNPTEVSEAMDLVTMIRFMGITVFMIEHVMKAIMNVCDRIMVLHHGEMIADGTPSEISTSKTVIEAYLGE